jgi:uncharacterized protein YunC (DUF1805 family)
MKQKSGITFTLTLIRPEMFDTWPAKGKTMEHLPPAIPSQTHTPPPCPTCKRPLYSDVEHNPLCAAIQNLESLMYRGAGTLEVDQAERWADLHSRMTGIKSECDDALKAEVNSLRQRIAQLEELVTRPAAEKPEPQDTPPNQPGEQTNLGERQQPAT